MTWQEFMDRTHQAPIDLEEVACEAIHLKTRPGSLRDKIKVAAKQYLGWKDDFEKLLDEAGWVAG